MDELLQAAENGMLEEAFGTGTAAVISPINKLRYKGNDIIVSNGAVGKLSRVLK